ncbi:unnamed protein product, partial [Effrenium voratum]
LLATSRPCSNCGRGRPVAGEPPHEGQAWPARDAGAQAGTIDWRVGQQADH